jgi:myo-inositol-1(or 4)-monophosphatase
MQALLNTAVDAARKAGDLALRYFSRAHQLDVQTKGRNEFVTQVDHAAEQIIIEAIRARYPDHAVLAEESGRDGDSDYVWIIDPLDGTTNYIHSFPVFAVSIGLEVSGQLELGVVYDPCRQEIFTAMRGEGAQLEGRKIRVSRRPGLEGALIGTGFPYRANQEWLDSYLEMLGKVLTSTAGIRRPGAAALDLCYVAAGRLDGFWEYGLAPWDLAAGAIILREAGGLIGPLEPDTDWVETGNVIAGNPKVYKELADLLQSSQD